MSFIESILDPDEKERYKSMLDTFYILLMCDQAFIKEYDEKDIDYQSATWLYSYKTFYDAIGYGRHSYPQGSISANRLFYKALKNYYSSFAVKNKLVNHIRVGLGNFLKLRREDSSPFLPSYMYGSAYEIVDDKGLGNKGKMRIVSKKINFRHTANALSLLFSDTSELNDDLLVSYKSLLNKLKELFRTNNDEKNLHITLSSILNVLHSFLDKYSDHELSIETEYLIVKCEERLLSTDAIIQESNGYYKWKLMSDGFRSYDYYLTFFTFEQYPYILKNEKAQKILKNIIENNQLYYRGLPGIPLSSLDQLNEMELKPDYGITISLVYVMQFCIDNNIGDTGWIKYCKEKIRPFFKFCLKNFDDQSIHQITMLESAAKSLLLPNIELSKERDESNLKIINTIRKQIESSPKSLSLKIVDWNKDYKFVIDYINRWDIRSHTEKDSNNKLFYLLSDIASIFGRLSVVFAKEYYS